MAFQTLTSLAGSGIPDWFITIVEYGLTITSTTHPETIRDNKRIIYAAQPVPGIDGSVMAPHRLDNGDLQFTVEFFKYGAVSGNQALIDQTELLRHPVLTAGGLIKQLYGERGISLQFCTVIYAWGTHRPPLLYRVEECNLTHDTFDYTSSIGYSQRTRATMRLSEITSSKLYRAWMIKLAIYANTVGRVRSLEGGRKY